MNLPIHTLAINLTNRCNARCVHCGYWRTDQAPDEITDFAPFYRAIADVARLAPGATLALTGGEPFLSPELFPIIRFARPLGYGKIVVTTNGLAVGERGVDEICSSGLDELIVSLDGFAPTHDRFRGVPGAFDKVDRLLDAVHARDPHPETVALATISEANLGELRDFFSHLVNDPRIARVVFQVITQTMPDIPRPDWYLSDPLWPRNPEHAARVLNWLIVQAECGAKIQNTPAQLRTMRRYFLAPERIVWRRCNVGTRYVHLETDGGVKNCVQMPDLGNIRDEPIEAILTGPRAAARLSAMRDCGRNCHFLINCGFVEGEAVDG